MARGVTGDYSISPFEAIRSAVSPPELALRMGYNLSRSDNILCPAHPDSSPSCKVYPDHYHCFACGWHGDIFDFVCTDRNCQPKEAAIIIAELFGLNISFDMAQDRRAELVKAQKESERIRAERDEKCDNLQKQYLEKCDEIKAIEERLRKIPKSNEPRFAVIADNEKLLNAIGETIARKAVLEREAEEINDELYHMRR